MAASPKELLDKMLPGDVIVTSVRGMKALGSLPIRFANYFKRGYDDRIWTHSALYVGNGEVVEAFPSGIVKRNFESAYLSQNAYDLVVLRRHSATPAEMERAIAFCNSQSGRPYDKKAIAYFVILNILPPTLSWIMRSKLLDKCLNTENSYFCSELVAQGLLESEQYCFDREPYQVMPVDFKNTFGFQVIAEVRDSKRPSEFKRALTAIGYFLITVFWTLILIIAAAAIWAGILWVWAKLKDVSAKPAKEAQMTDAKISGDPKVKTNSSSTAERPL